MARQAWLADVIADEFRGSKGFRVDAYPNWTTRGATLFDPEGVMDHHTGPGSYNALLAYMAEGPVHPPLCNVATSRPSSGVVRITVVAAGRANHAGVGELPWRRGQGSTGNRRTLGLEHQNDGGQSWPGQQVEAIRRLDACLLRHMGHTAARRTDHRIYAPGRKPDRHSVTQRTEDDAVNALIRRQSDPRSWFEMATEQQLRDIVRGEVDRGITELMSTRVRDGGNVATRLHWAHEHSKRTRDDLRDVVDMLETLGESVEAAAAGDRAAASECVTDFRRLADAFRAAADTLENDDV